MFSFIKNFCSTAYNKLKKAYYYARDKAIKACSCIKRFVVENTVETIVVIGVSITGCVKSGAIAAYLGKLGILGKASTDTLISTLKGAALIKAALAKIGGGALATGGFGILGGIIVITATCGLLALASCLLFKKLKKTLNSIPSPVNRQLALA